MIRMGETSASGKKERGDPGQENILPVGSEEVGVSWGEGVSVFGRKTSALNQLAALEESRELSK